MVVGVRISPSPTKAQSMTTKARIVLPTTRALHGGQEGIASSICLQPCWHRDQPIQPVLEASCGLLRFPAREVGKNQFIGASRRRADSRALIRALLWH